MGDCVPAFFGGIACGLSSAGIAGLAADTTSVALGGAATVASVFMLTLAYAAEKGWL